MRIIRLTAENFKRLVAVDITPGDQPVVKITGKNGQGKTSVLDAIWAALKYPGVKEIRHPVRDGAKRAEITIELDDLVVKRVFEDEGSTHLLVTDRNGMQARTPQTLLDSFIGKLTFDPLEFLRMKEKEQVQTLVELLDIDEYYKLIDQREKIFDERTTTHRRLRDVKGRLAGTPPKQVEPVSVRELSREYDKLLKQRERWYQAQRDLDQAQELLADLKDELKRLQERVKKGEQVVKSKTAALEKLPNPDLSDLQKQMDSADEINKQAEVWKRWQEDKKYAAELETLAAEQTDQLKKIDEKVRNLLRNSKLPVKGLELTEEGLLLNGHPFKQSASDAEQLRVSVAVAMMANPTLRVMRVRDGSLLDQESLKLLEKMAADEDYQVWLETVEGESGVVIEDGQVKQKK